MSDINDNIDFRPLSEGLGFHQKKPSTRSQSASEFEVPTVDLDVMGGKASLSEKSGSSASLPMVSAPQSARALQKAQTSPSPNTRTMSLGSASISSTQNFRADEVDDLTTETSSLTPVWMRPVEQKYNPWAGDVDIGREPSVDGVVERDIDNSTLIDNPFFVPQKITSPVEVVTLRFSGYDGLRKKKSKPTLPSFTAIAMDVLTLVSICMIFFAVVLTAMGESLSSVLSELPRDAAGRSYFLGIVLSVSFMYMILARSLFGQTIGEWMMYMQLGSDEDRAKASYPIKVFVRTVVVFLSGLIVFPILSLLAGKDILMYFSGLEMHGEKASSNAQQRNAEHEFSRAATKK